MGSLRKLFLIVVSLGIALAAAQASPVAEPTVAPGFGDVVQVKIRSVEASGRSEAGISEEQIEELDERLADISEKLSSLPFKNFKILTEQEFKVPMTTKQVAEVGLGQSVEFRPLYRNGGRVGMWIHWTDEKGAELLDTRMHFACSERVLTGAETDMVGDKAVILAMTVHPE